MPTNQRGKTYPLVAVGLAAFLVFANSLGNGLVYDDHFLIERNRLLREADVWGILTTHYWGGYEGEANVNGQYRPLTVLSFMLDGLGGIWPFRFHLTNVILHVVNSLLAYLLCLSLGLKRGAILAGLLFAVHPIHAEVVAGITFGRADLLAGLFSLSALFLYIHWHNRSTEKYYGLALAGFFLALLSKESALTVLGLVIAIDLTLSPGNGIRNLLWQRSARWAGFIGTFILYLTLRKVAANLGFSAENILALNNPLIDQPLDYRLSDSRRTLLEILYSRFVSLQIIRRLLLQRHTRHHLYTRARSNSGHNPRHRRSSIVGRCFLQALALRIFCSIIILCALFSRIANARPDQRHFSGAISIPARSRIIRTVWPGI